LSEIIFLYELFGKLAQFPTWIRSAGRARCWTAVGFVACLLNAAASAQALAPLGINPTSVSGVQIEAIERMIERLEQPPGPQ